MILQTKKLFALIDVKTRKGLIGIFVLMVCTAVLETVGISLFIPLLHFLTSPAPFESSSTMAAFLKPLNEIERNKLIALFCIVLSGFFIFKAVAVGIITFIQNSFITRHQAVFAQGLLRIYLGQSYSFHLQSNSMELIRNITLLSSRIFVKGLLPVLQILMEVMVMAGILTVLLLVAPLPTIAMGIVLGISVAAYYVLIRNRIFDWGQNSIRLDKEILVWVNQALGSIKETKLYGHEAFFENAFRNPSIERAVYVAKSTTAPHLPRLFIEAISICSLSAIVLFYVIEADSDIDAIIPTIGLFAVAAMRLMPSLGKIVSAITTYRENKSAIDIIFNDVFQTELQVSNDRVERLPQREIVFSKDLVLRNIGYVFPQSTEYLIRNLNLSIKKGEAVAFVGASGAGKTTLVDIILGLLEATEGQIEIDGRPMKDEIKSWQSSIGYIPQNIYILDDSLRHNIALGQSEDQISDERIFEVISKAQLNAVLDALPDGLDTRLGEHGSRLSGGQRQRIGIARALYNKPQVLVMDEATSALDNQTENEITTDIKSLSGEKTVLIVAHRLSTIRHCDKIVLMDNGQIVDIGTFNDLESRCPQFKRLVDLSNLQVLEKNNA